MKAILSQSPFCAVATHHGGGNENNILIADLDSNGWPQSAVTVRLNWQEKDMRS